VDSVDDTEDDAFEEESDTDDEGVVGRRLELIPHSVDPSLVFRFEFGPAILAQVIEQLDQLPQRPLTSEALQDADYAGFYQLFRNGISVYVGRTIRPVRQRLLEHIKKLRGRIALDEMTCKFVFVEDLTLVGLSEDSLINYFHPRHLDDWGTGGFGSKATGHGRAGQTSRWHEANPADLRIAVTAGGAKVTTLLRLIRQVGSNAPVVLSIPAKYVTQFREDFPSVSPVEEQSKPFEDWITSIEATLGSTWIIDRQPMGWYIVPNESN